MANTRELRRRIKSVKNTAQITKAMQMVAATKMRRAQNQALNSRPYSDLLDGSIVTLLDKINPEAHPLLQDNDSGKSLVIVFSTDKGLVGALNSNIARSVARLLRDFKSLDFITVGKKGRSFVIRSGQHIEADFENPTVVNSRLARQIAKIVLDKFLAAEVGKVHLIYPNFVSALRQEPTLVKLLPIEANSVIANSEGIKPTNGKIIASPAHSKVNFQSDNFMFEPNKDELLDFILTHLVETRIYQALLETKASEYSAQMIAMQNATENAQELVEDLNLTYNQTRQDAITRELLEITSASLALE